MDFRLFIGGLFPDVTKEDLRGKFKSFGEVKDVDIIQRKDDKGIVSKTFGYIDLVSSTQQVNKCFALFGGTKWKGNELKVQLAKENFMAKLEKERADPEYYQKKKKNKNVEPMKFYDEFLTKTSQMKRAVPGTPIEGEKNWVVGKYGRPLPIVALKPRYGRKLVKVDPSKQCHCLRRLPDNEIETGNFDTLTWHITEKNQNIQNRHEGKKISKRKMSVTSESDADVDSDKEEEKCKKKKKVKKNAHEKMASKTTETTSKKNILTNNDASEPTDLVKSEIKKKKKNTEKDTSSATEIPLVADVVPEVEDDDDDGDKVMNDDVMYDIIINDSNVLSSDDVLVEKETQLSNSIVEQLLEGHKGSLSEQQQNDNKISDGENLTSSSDDTDTAVVNMFDFDLQSLKQFASSKSNSSKTKANRDKTVLSEDEEEDVPSNSIDFNVSHLLEGKCSTAVKKKAEKHNFIANAKLVYVDHSDSSETSSSSSEEEEDGEEEGEEEEGEEEESDKNNSTNNKDESMFEFNLKSLKKNSSKLVQPWSAEQFLQNISLKHMDVTDSDNESSSSSESELDNNLTNNTKQKIHIEEKKTETSSNERTEKNSAVVEREVKPSKVKSTVVESKTVVEKTKKIKKTPGKSKKILSEEMRLKSLENRTKASSHQKQAVREALKNIDTSSTKSQKITFDDDGEESNEEYTSNEEKNKKVVSSSKAIEDVLREQEEKEPKKKKNLFEDSEDEDNDDADADVDEENTEFKLKTQFQGKDGEKLFKMQQRFGSDVRFRMDERFIDDDVNNEDDDEDENNAGLVSTSKNAAVTSENLTEDDNLVQEKNRNLSILEEMFSKPLQEKHKRKHDKETFERYDPTRDDHAKFEVKKPTAPTTDEPLEKDEEIEEKTNETKPPEVSEEKYFEVNTTLKSLFNTNAQEKGTSQDVDVKNQETTSGFSGFSFLNEEPEEEKEKEEIDERQEEDNMEDIQTISEKPKKKELSWKAALEETSSRQARYEESLVEDRVEKVPERKPYKLFFALNDERFEKGRSFKQSETIEEITNQWKGMRSSLHQNYKKKHKDALRRVRKLKERRFARK